MSGRKSIPRYLTLLLAAHARHVLLRRRLFWAEGMEQEAHYIEDDWDALHWALGCVFASYREVLKAERFFLPFFARMYLAAICLRYALAASNGPIAILQCRLYAGPFTVPAVMAMHPFLRQFVYAPVMMSGHMCTRWGVIPLWMHAVWVGVAALYLVAALRLVQGRASAFPVFICALLSSALAFGVAQFVPGVYFGDPSWYWRGHSFLWHHSVLPGFLFVIWWSLIVCLCIGLVVNIDKKRTTPG